MQSIDVPKAEKILSTDEVQLMINSGLIDEYAGNALDKS